MITDEQFAQLLHEVAEIRQDIKKLTAQVEKLPLDNMATGLFIVESLSIKNKSLTDTDIQAYHLLKRGYMDCLLTLTQSR